MACVDHVGGCVGHGRPAGAARVEHAQVGLHALCDKAAVVASLAQRAGAGCRAQDLLRGDGRGVQGGPAGAQGHDVHVLHHVVVVVGRAAVGAQRHVDPLVEHALDRREAAAQLHVGDGVRRDEDAAVPQDLEIGFFQPDAMRCSGGVLEYAQALEVLDGRHAVVALLAFLGFQLGLARMQMDAQAALLGQLRDIPHDDGVAGVFGVDVVVHQQTPVLASVEALDQLVVQLADGVFGIGLGLECQQAFGGIHLHARFGDCAETVFGAVVHVGEAHGAVAQHLGACQHGAPVVVFGRHLRLEGPDAVVEPFLQGQRLAVAAQDGHGRMRVGVEEAGHEQAIRSCVLLAVGFGVFGRAGAHVCDAVVYGADPAVFDHIEILVEDADIFEKHGSSLGLRCWGHSIATRCLSRLRFRATRPQRGGEGTGFVRGSCLHCAIISRFDLSALPKRVARTGTRASRRHHQLSGQRRNATCQREPIPSPHRSTT